MTIRLHILAAVTALAGHLVGVVGMPLPSTESVAPSSATIAKKSDRKCRCACGGGCGTVCCCCGDSAPPADEPVAPSSDTETKWHWVASVQAQKCHGIGPASLIDLPPGLPTVQPVSHIHLDLATASVHLSPITAVSVSGSPPTPPPRNI
jgi:hypothetical protein